MITRRRAIHKFFATAAVSISAMRWPSLKGASTAPEPSPGWDGESLELIDDLSVDPPFKLAPLPYAFDALEPQIDAQTMEIHHDRHHQAYVDNLNKALAGHPDLQRKSLKTLLSDLDSIPAPIRTAIRNHGGGHANHSLFWQVLSKKGGGKPKGALAAAVDRKFLTFEKFQEQFTKAATGVFGSGWVWLSLNPRKELELETTPNQDSPFSKGNTPLVGLDVWEHAYYLKYQNRRADYIAAFYNIINWDYVAGRYGAVQGKV